MSMDLSFLWSLLAMAAFFKTIIPPDFFRFLDDFQRQLFQRFSLYHHTYINDTSGLGSNDLFDYVHLYATTLNSSANALSATCPQTTDKLTFAMADNEQTSDVFRGTKIQWEYRIHTVPGSSEFPRQVSERRSYKLTVSKTSREIIPDYLQMVLRRGKEIEREQSKRQLYTNMYDFWESVKFKHPATFDTVAMEPEMKKLLMADLSRFMNGKEYYAGVGRAWKRGYLLYGPPGSGKSSLIGAISNFTGYDVYDLELTKVQSNMELRQLLIHVKNRSIVVVEDIDCSIPIRNRKSGEKKPRVVGSEVEGVTLSGLLNFTDGLWSSCGSERIFIFTTNYVERLDEALLRPGRMDVHIHMSYCTFAVFKQLALRYLKVEKHELFPVINELFKTEVKMSPASVIEVLLRHEDDPTRALENLVSALSNRIPTQELGDESEQHDHDHDEEDDAESICSEDEKSSAD